MRVEGVLDGQRMQAELLFERRDLVRGRRHGIHPQQVERVL